MFNIYTLTEQLLIQEEALEKVTEYSYFAKCCNLSLKPEIERHVRWTEVKSGEHNKGC